MGDFFTFFFLRNFFGIGFPINILVILALIGCPSFKTLTGARLWVVICLAVSFGWRILWLGSSYGRGTRYYMLLGALAILLFPASVRGAQNLGRFFRVEKLAFPPGSWWCIFAVAVTVAGCGVGLHISATKEFLVGISRDIELRSREYRKKSTVILDGTSERARLKELLNDEFPIVALPKLVENNQDHFLRELVVQWMDAAAQYDHIFLLVRQSSRHELDQALKEVFKAEKVAEYRFRLYEYSLFLLQPTRLYTPEQLAFLRQCFREEAVFSFSPTQAVQLDFDKLFFFRDRSSWIVAAQCNWGEYDREGWYWSAASSLQNTGSRNELTLTLWPRHGGLPVGQKKVRLNFQPGASEHLTATAIPVPVASPSVMEEEKFKETAVDSRPQKIRRILFLGYGITYLNGLNKLLPPEMEVISNAGQDSSESGFFAESAGLLFQQNYRNPYWSNGSWNFADRNFDTLVILLGMRDLMFFSGADLLWPFRMDRLFGELETLLINVRERRSDVQFVLGTLPPLPDGRSALWRYPDANVEFYNQAVMQFNQRLVKCYANRENEGIYLIGLDSCFPGEMPDKTQDSWNYTGTGKDKISEKIHDFFSEKLQ